MNVPGVINIIRKKPLKHEQKKIKLEKGKGLRNVWEKEIKYVSVFFSWNKMTFTFDCSNIYKKNVSKSDIGEIYNLWRLTVIVFQG